jgi:uncharacterized protein (DUF1810 family)
MDSLDRFKKAQDGAHAGFEVALAELRAGCKQSHWIWYIFPQLAGLGSSGMAQAYGLDGVEEATRYLQDPGLRSRLLTIAAVAAGHTRRGVPLETLMGASIDVLKLVSSMTLFADVARRLHAAEGLAEYEAMARVAEEILAVARAQGYPACQFTRARLGKPCHDGGGSMSRA